VVNPVREKAGSTWGGLRACKEVRSRRLISIVFDTLKPPSTRGLKVERRWSRVRTLDQFPNLKTIPNCARR
jgi:hypothetical protein